MARKDENLTENELLMKATIKVAKAAGMLAHLMHRSYDDIDDAVDAIEKAGFFVTEADAEFVRAEIDAGYGITIRAEICINCRCGSCEIDSAEYEPA